MRTIGLWTVWIICFCAFVMLTACKPAPNNCGNFSTPQGNSMTVPPTGPTSVYCGPVTTLDNRPGGTVIGTDTDTGTGTDTDTDTDNDNDGDAPSTSPVGTNADGRTIYRIGQGQTFVRTGGNAGSVWCRPGSGCNGDNRTLTNAGSPPRLWVEDGYAYFRRSGSAGVWVIFTVDGVRVTHSF